MPKQTEKSLDELSSDVGGRTIKRDPAWKIALREIYELVRIFVIALVIVIPIRYFVFQTFTVNGASMEPNFHNADYLIIDELSYRLRPPERGEVIVFRYPVDPSEFFIKRVIGLPGETVEVKNGDVYVGADPNKLSKLNEAYLPKDHLTYGGGRATLGPSQYYVMGDNRNASLDSRTFGPLDKRFITGKTALRGWPFDRVAFFAAPEYNLGNK